MKVTIESQGSSRGSADLLVLALPQMEQGDRLPSSASALDRELGGRIGALVASEDFRGRRDETLLLFSGEGAALRRVVLAGLGEEAKLDTDALRRLGGRAVAAARGRRAKSVSIALPATRRVRIAESAQAIAEGAVLASYRHDGWKTGTKDAPPELTRATLLVPRSSDLRPARAAAALGTTLADCQNVARRLSNEPANLLPPTALASEARKIAKEVGLACRVFDVPEMRRLKMGALLAVGQGSANPPRLVVLEHRPARGGRKHPTICIVGKGITFDSGGISIKPSGGMHEMKHDMSGAAAVVGILRAAALLKLPLHVVGVVASAENMPSGDAYRPGDVLRSMSGQTIEIQNTDAEGRLVLCDAIHYARSEFEPAAIVDLATLTGACVVALGSCATGVFSNHDGLCSAIRKAGETTGERAWPLPLWDEHREGMRSKIADLKNVSGSRDAGASMAAGFLAAFVGDTPWAHLDIAGTGYTSKPQPEQPFGATGVGVRMVTELLRSWPRAGL